MRRHARVHAPTDVPGLASSRSRNAFGPRNAVPSPICKNPLTDRFKIHHHARTHGAALGALQTGDGSEDSRFSRAMIAMLTSLPWWATVLLGLVTFLFVLPELHMLLERRFNE